MGVKLTEEMLKEIIPKATQINLEKEMPKLINQPPVEFSPEMERKMNRLIRKSKKINLNTSKMLKKVACFGLIFIVGGMTVVMQVEAYRAELFKTLNQFFGTYGVTWFEVIETEEEIELKEPTYLPNGYEKINEIKKNDFVLFEYVSSNKDIIRVEAYKVKEELKVYIDTETIFKEKIPLNEGNAELYKREKKNKQLLFYKGSIRYTITVKDNFSKDELTKIANSL